MVEVLLVEDNPRDAELTMRALKKNSLVNRIVHVEDGVEALDLLFRRGKYAGNTIEHPKVMLLDLKLPKLNGLEVLRVIKSNEQTRSILVVVVTSSAEDRDVRAAYMLGANSYIIKPVGFDAFLKTMNSLGYYWITVNHLG